MEQFRADLKPFCGSHADWERFDAGLSMLKEQEAVVLCKYCKKRGEYDCHITSLTGQASSGDWFCADGERKENDG